MGAPQNEQQANFTQIAGKPYEHIADSSWEHMDDSKLRWLTEQGEKRLAATWANAAEIDRKVFALLGISLSLLTASVGYALSRLTGELPWAVYMRETGFAWAAAFCLSYAVAAFLRAAWTYEVDAPGGRPAGHMKEPYVQRSLEDMVNGHVVALDKSIHFNRVVNERRLKLAQRGMVALAVLPLAAALAAFAALLAQG